MTLRFLQVIGLIVAGQLLSFQGEPAAQMMLRAKEISSSWFEAQGDSLQGIKESIRKFGPKDPHGVSRDAVTLWSLRWAWPTRENGLPNLQEGKASVNVRVVLPTISSFKALSLDEQREWGRYYSALVKHEYAHAKRALRTKKEIQQKISVFAKSNDRFIESKLRESTKALVLSNRNWDLWFDSTTDHGRSEGVLLSDEIGAIKEKS